LRKGRNPHSIQHKLKTAWRLLPVDIITIMNTVSRTSALTSVILITALITYAALIISCCHYERLTGDAFLYISIAEKYIRGDLSNAINGYWGPLLSWLLIPFLAAGSSHVFAINLLNLIFGLFTIIGVGKLSCRFEIGENIRSIILLALVPILLFISLIQPMDFLLLCILVYYLSIVFHKDYPEKLSYAALSGFLGACAYFSKAYGFPFFISHFLLMNACHYYGSSSRDMRKKVLRNVFVGFVVFSLLSGVWITLISIKYNHLTFSNMGRGVFASLGPGSEHGTLEKGDPIFSEGFFEPPNETAIVIYEDPSYARKKTWSPLESGKSFKHYVSNLSENFFEGLRIYESFSRLSFAILLAYILMLFAQPRNTLFTRRDILYPIITIILYTGGYAPFHFETRYLWIINILLLLMGGRVLDELLRSDFMKKGIMKKILITFFILSFVISPIKASTEIGKNGINREMFLLGTKLNKQYEIKGNIASNRHIGPTASHDSWHRTFRLAYWLNSRYYGQPQENISDEELKGELEKYGIDYYFFWGDPEGVPQFLFQYRELTNGDIPGLKIYSLNEKRKT